MSTTLGRPKIVALDTTPITFAGVDMRVPLQLLGEVTLHGATMSDEVLARAGGAEIVLTNKTALNAETLAALAAKGLRYVGVLATGYNVVDVDAAKRLGIAVTNVPGYAMYSVAQHVWALILNAANSVALHAQDVAQNGWAQSGLWCRQRVMTMGLHGKTLGIIGYGDIGREVAKIGVAFGMNILIGAVPGRNYAADSERLPLQKLLPECDIVSLHCPQTPATTRMVNAEFLLRMKGSAMLVNAGRGALVDEDALLRRLKQGLLGHAALDVLAQEPPPVDHPLVLLAKTNPGVLTITGHCAWTTPEARRELVNVAADNIRAFLRGESRNRIV